MSAQMFTSDSSILTQTIENEGDVKFEEPTAADELPIKYDLDMCVDWIKTRGFERVCLQFPDYLLPDSALISLYLKNRLHQDVYILGDTSYGSCCVDDVAAQHISADAIIHFGHACLSPTSRLPVLHIFPKKSLDLDKLIEQFRQTFNDRSEKIVIFYDVAYAHHMELLEKSLESYYDNLFIPKLNCQSNCPFVDSKETESDTILGRILPSAHAQDLNLTTAHTNCQNLSTAHAQSSNSHSAHGLDQNVTTAHTQNESPSTVHAQNQSSSTAHAQNETLSSAHALFIGTEGRTLMNFALTIAAKKWHLFDTENQQIREISFLESRWLKRRRFLMEKLRDAKTVGIVIATLTIVDYLKAVKFVKQTLTKMGKKTYILSVGKINPAKLANFTEMDAFVVIACPESEIFDSKDFLQPLLLPYEVDFAFNANRDFTLQHCLDFRRILPDAPNYVEFKKPDSETDVSLISGNVRDFSTSDEIKNGDERISSMNALSCKNSGTVAIGSAGASFLLERQWRGLEQRLGEDEVQKTVEKGRTGLPIGYENESHLSCG